MRPESYYNNLQPITDEQIERIKEVIKHYQERKEDIKNILKETYKQ